MTREAWTDERLDDLNVKVDTGFAHVDTRFEEVNRRLDGIDRRLDGIDRRLERVDERLGQLAENLEAIARMVARGGIALAVAAFGVIGTLLAILATQL